MKPTKPLYLLFYSLGGAYIAIALMVMIWQSRQRVAEAILPANAAAAPGGLRAAFARYWHYLASVYVLIMGMFWVADVLLGGKATVLNLLLSLFVIPVFIGIDQWAQRLLKQASGEFTEIVDLSGETVREVPPPTGESRIKHYVPLIRRLLRLVLVAFMFFIVLGLWGVDLAFGRIFTSHVLSIVVTLLLGFIVWEFTKARIDSRLRQEMPAADTEGEGGGPGGTRTGTLLLLLRKFILTVLFVLVSLIVLSSIGVNIGPLIAGAGVVGLAIGFGSQALVRDIIAGVFFMIDDSFRLGDYVESTGVKGTVEQISLRSIKLRHPRGMVYTVPFGNLKSITNFSRDYTITKLDIRVGFDTDLEKVRKLIKKINKTLRKNEEINRVMLDDLKSMGIKEFDDSAMIVRVKFKTLAGEQFLLKKEVYRMIREEFQAAGIDFASRNVTVSMTPELRPRASATGEPGGAADPIYQAGAAAALALIQEEEKRKPPWRQSRKRNKLSILDPRLRSQGVCHQMKRSVHIGILILTVTLLLCGCATLEGLPQGSVLVAEYEGPFNGKFFWGSIQVKVYEAPGGARPIIGWFNQETAGTYQYFRGAMKGSQLAGQFTIANGNISGELSADGALLTGVYNFTDLPFDRGTWNAKKK